jgi:DNA-binding transcriptional regulator GbsR (MarR family)
MDIRMHPNVERFVERLGLLWEVEGLPRIAGKIFGFLLVEGGELTLEELAEALQVSRGSVSTNTRLLEAQGSVERVTRPGDRRVYYRVGDEPYRASLERMIRRLRRTCDLISEVEDGFPPEMEVGVARLGEMSLFYTRAIDAAVEFLHEWEGAHAAT